jgi:hypothetical protein
MKKKIEINIDWKSKIIDLLIVIMGISIAFKLNTWNESKKANREIEDYLLSFQEESTNNKATLSAALEYSTSIKKDLDSLKILLIKENYGHKNIKTYASSLMGLSNFMPVTTTMDNITASGQFGLIKNAELKKRLIDTYKIYKSTIKMDDILMDYVDKYLTPYFFENVRFRDFSSIKGDFINNPEFENIVLGYEVLLNQQIQHYENAMGEIDSLLDTIQHTSQ